MPILPCNCTGADEILVKSAAVRREAKPRLAIPWFSRTVGVLFQEARYGKGNRWHNEARKGPKLVGYTCTICNRLKLI